jgi:hypothetical protein
LLDGCFGSMKNVLDSGAVSAEEWNVMKRG